ILGFPGNRRRLFADSPASSRRLRSRPSRNDMAKVPRGPAALRRFCLVKSRQGGARVKTGKIAIGVGLGVYLFGFGMLTGALMERMRFDRHSSEVLCHYE